MLIRIASVTNRLANSSPKTCPSNVKNVWKASRASLVWRCICEFILETSPIYVTYAANVSINHQVSKVTKRSTWKRKHSNVMNARQVFDVKLSLRPIFCESIQVKNLTSVTRVINLSVDYHISKLIKISILVKNLLSATHVENALVN